MRDESADLAYERGVGAWIERGEFWPRWGGVVTSAVHGLRAGYLWLWRFHFWWQV